MRTFSKCLDQCLVRRLQQGRRHPVTYANHPHNSDGRKDPPATANVPLRHVRGALFPSHRCTRGQAAAKHGALQPTRPPRQPPPPFRMQISARDTVTGSVASDSTTPAVASKAASVAAAAAAAPPTMLRREPSRLSGRHPRWRGDVLRCAVQDEAVCGCLREFPKRGSVHSTSILDLSRIG